MAELRLDVVIADISQQLQQSEVIIGSLEALGGYPSTSETVLMVETVTMAFTHYHEKLEQANQALAALREIGYPTMPHFDVAWSIYLSLVEIARHIQETIEQVTEPLMAKQAVITPGVPQEQ